MRRPDFDRLAALDRQLARERPVDHAQNLQIVEGLRQEAVALGVWPPADPLAGIEADIRLVQAIHAVRGNRLVERMTRDDSPHPAPLPAGEGTS